ncbi:MAG: hypothetical protein PHO37_09650 [Kiritimatiellae bacterium]|nr:hypothetical protein [Kiritimatiellia bacterium]
MKYLILIPFAVLLGLAVGSWAPKSDLIKVRQELKELEKKLEKQNTGGKLSALNSIIKIPERKSGRKPAPFKGHAELADSESDDTSEAATNLLSDASTTNTPSESPSRRRRHFPDPKSKNFEEDLEEAKELWQTRVEMARSQWLAKLKLNQEESALFDQAMADMNDKLYLTMQAVAMELQNTDQMSTETGIRIMNEVTTTLVETYEQIGKVVPPEQRPQVESMQMQDFIDPAAFDPLIDVRDKL